MSPLTVFSESLRSLGRNRVRALLSILGIVIGIAAVIAMVAVGAGAQRAVEQEIAQMGDDWIMVFVTGTQGPGNWRRDPGITSALIREDIHAILEQCSQVRAISLSTRGYDQVISQYGNHTTSIRGVEPVYFDILRCPVGYGRDMTVDDVQKHVKACWLGTTVAKELFGNINPIGKTVRIRQVPLEVAGILKSRGTGRDGGDYDDRVLLPVTTHAPISFDDGTARTFLVAAKSSDMLGLARKQVRRVLRERHRLADNAVDDFRMYDCGKTAEKKEETTRIFKALLTSIASISLLVGGVGIMNIMLVSVTERTREIGLRMAIGANGFHILGQFLCEAVVLCLVGGGLGFVAGWGLANFVSVQLQETFPVQYEISYWMAGVAIGFSMIVGVFFGFYPAWRASRLDPIEALRFE